MTFAEPTWLLLGAVACAGLLWLFRQGDARRREDLTRFAAESLIGHLTRSLSPGRRAAKRCLLALAVALSAAALARPHWGFYWKETHRKGLDLLFAVDTSKSMLAQDIRPDRLTRAKMAVEDLLEKMGGDRVGLVAFAGTAFLQCPLTLDYDAFRQSLEALDVNVIPRGGTDLAAAIREAVAALEGKGDGERILILLTDGEDLAGDALAAARTAAQGGLRIFAVGVGSAAGELVPVPDGNGGNTFARDREGQFVRSRLDEATLGQIAASTGGLYEPLGTGSVGLETIYEKGLAPFTRHDVASRMQKVPLERFQWPLAAALLCLLTEPLIGLRRRVRRKAATQGSARANALVAAWNRLARASAPPALALAAFAMPQRCDASAHAAERAYRDGDYATSAEHYREAAAKNPDQPALVFNQGAAHYKAGDFDAAAEAFTRALKTDDLRLQQDDYYNLGNARYRIGQGTEASDTEKTIAAWEKAIEAYETALQLNPADTDAQFNRDLVKRKLEELKQKQQQQDQEDNQKQNSQDQKQDQQQQDQQNQSQAQQSPREAQQQNEPQRQDRDQPQQAQTEPKQEGSTPPQAQANPQDGQGGREQEPRGQPIAQNEQPPQGDASDAQREPGGMSREEARQLLDSLRDGDRKMPLVPCARTGGRPQEHEVARDW